MTADDEWFITKKAWKSVSVAVLPIEASRIARWKSDGNAEAHAGICDQCYGAYLSRDTSIHKYYIPTGIYRCSILDFLVNFARIPIGQEQARMTLSLYVDTPCLTYHPSG